MSAPRTRTRAIAVALATFAVGLGLVGAPTHAVTRAAARPNIVIIVTDDQRFDTLWAMPEVERLLVDEGVNYTNSFVPNSLCCPSRASMLTSSYSHTSGVYGNKPPWGGFSSFDDQRTVATALHGQGYATMFAGKYLNGYPSHHWDYVPPGWDRWFAVPTGAYYHYHAADDGQKSKIFGLADRDYSGHVITRRAIADVRHADPSSPFFLYYAPAAPHGSNAAFAPAHHLPVPDHRDKGFYAGLEPWRPRSYGRARAGSPQYIQDIRWATSETARWDKFRQRQLEALRGVDRNVSKLLASLPPNTVIVYTSDNGYLWGEHRWRGKQVPYDEALRVPLVIRYPDGWGAGTEDPRLALNIDVVPSVLTAAGFDPSAMETGTEHYDGADTPVAPEGLDLRGSATHADTVLEHWDVATKVPGYCGLRTADGFMYARYDDAAHPSADDGFEELYDLRADPLELRNVAADPAYASELADLRTRAQAACDPVPPYFSW
jgi:N-acetylglucosamine-6-sulfatase